MRLSIRIKLTIILLVVTMTTLLTAMGIALWHSANEVRALTIQSANEKVAGSAATLSG